MHNKLVVSGGLLATGYLWQQYSDSALNHASNQLNQFIQNYQQLPQTLKQYFTVPWLVGVSLGSQVFIKACGNHSPVVNFAEKTILGFGYFIPTAFAAAIAENIFTNKVEYWVVKGISLTAGMFAGGLSGSFLEHNVGSGLDKVAVNVDWVAGLAKLTLVTIASSLIGKTHAEPIEEGNYQAISNGYCNTTESYDQEYLVAPAIVEANSL